MKNIIFNKSFCLVILLSLLSISSASAVTLYENDFNSGPSDFLTLIDEPLLSHISPSGESFAGQLGNDELTLSLNNIPVHTELTIALDLYIIRSWDGEGPFGPDIIEMSLDNEILLSESFSNVENKNQSFGSEENASSAPQTGASSVDSLGYDFFGDSIYSFVFNVEHSSSEANFRVLGIGLQGIFDESWGIDNLVVSFENVVDENSEGGNSEEVPEPGTLVLLTAALLAYKGKNFSKRS